MNKIVYLIIPIIVAIVYFSLNSGKNEMSYFEDLQAERKKRDEFMKTSEGSPFSGTGTREPFKGLQYFPIDPDYKVWANLTRLSQNEYVSIQLSDGTSEKYVKFAYADFRLKGNDFRLLLLKQAKFGSLDVIFTAFADNTSGVSTYGGGRYLDLNFKNAKKIILDFNRAYNPYCDYNDTFSCPLPPKENILPIEIRAGEKKYSNH